MNVMKRFLRTYIIREKFARRVVMALAALALTGPAVRAQDGSAAYNFLNVTGSSRIYGLGGVNISLVDDDIFNADQNPALLGQ